MLLVAVGVAFAAHKAAVRLIRRLTAARSEYLRSLLSRISGPTRMALVLFAFGAMLPLTPLSYDATNILARLLLVSFILMIGWSSLAAVGVFSDVYLRRFRIDEEDNLLARKHITQVRILRRTVDTLILLLMLGAALMTFSAVRQYGVSMLASAGAAGLVVGLAAQPVLSNLIAGVQLAITQPIRIEDAVVVEGEWGWIEEITATYVVIRLWDWRRLIVPLSYFIQKPFQNWTREGAAVIGTVLLRVDYTVPVDRIREKLTEIVEASSLWDKKVVNLQVTDAGEQSLELRCLVSARNSPTVWDLRCLVREKMIAFLQGEFPSALPRRRTEVYPLETAEPVDQARGGQPFFEQAAASAST
nr:mechanosensitive ion channel domain-containing protein [Faunimonas pinastri]